MILRTQSRVVRNAEKKMLRRMFADLRKTGNSIADIIDAQEEQRNLDNDIEAFINTSRAKTLGRLEEDLRNLFVLGSRYINKAVKGKVDMATINTMAVKRVQGLQYLGDTNIDESIANYSFTRVKEIVADGIFDGQSYKDIGQDIRKQINSGVFSKARAERIAVNMVGNAYEQGRNESMRDLIRQGEIVEKRRDTVGDSRVTRECRHNEEQGRIPFNANRPSGDNVAPRASNPNCRCTTNYEIL